MTLHPDFTRRMIAVPEGEIAVLDFGDPGRPVDVIFSNGNGFNAMCHRQALAPLGERLRIIAADQRGHGRTRLPVHPEGRHSWWDLAPDLIALVDALDLNQPVVLAGHSMGGTLSLMAAQTLRERMKAVVAFDPVLSAGARGPEEATPYIRGLMDMTLRRRTTFDSRVAAFAAYKGRGVFATWPDEVLSDYLVDGMKDVEGGVEVVCSPAWEASNYGAQGQDGQAILLAATGPVHVLKAGLHSTCQVTAEQAAANYHLKFETVEGATHCLPMERPDVVQGALVEAVEA